MSVVKKKHFKTAKKAWQLLKKLIINNRMRLVLEAAHREMHNRMHVMGHFHEHTPTEDHEKHH